MTGPTEGAALLAPLLHINGSSAATLSDQFAHVAATLAITLDALRAAAPNARDYYPQGDVAIAQAKREHESRVSRVADVLAEIEMIRENIYEQEQALADRSRPNR